MVSKGMQFHGRETNISVGRAQELPSLGSLLTDMSLGNFRAKIIGNDRACGLHVEEERRQRTLRCIGIMLSLLALLLVITNYSAWPGIRNGCERTEDRVLPKLGESQVDAESLDRVTEHRVGMLDVGGREILDGILERSKPGDKLDIC